VADVNTRKIEGVPAIREFAGAWADLARRRGRNRPFSAPGFALSALEAYHAGDRPAVIVAERAGVPDAVLPLVRRPLRKGPVTIGEIGPPRNPNVLVNDLLLPDEPAAAEEVLSALLKGLDHEQCDTVLLDHLPDLPGQVDALVRQSVRLGFARDDVSRSRDLFYVSVSGGYEDYLASRSSDHRWQLKKIGRKAREAGARIERVEGRQAIRSSLPILFDIETRSWQGATPGAAMTAEDHAFTAALLTDLDDDEVGELWLLHLADRPVAALRMLGGGDRLCVHTMFFDQQVKGLTPGALLLDAMLRSAWERNLAEVDLHGGSAFFRRWATGSRPHVSVRLYRPGLYGRLLHGGRHLAQRIGAWRRRGGDEARASEAA
jgi:hypothetical protein